MFQDVFEPEVVQSLTLLIVHHGLHKYQEIRQGLVLFGRSSPMALDYLIAAAALMPKTNQSFIPEEFVTNYRGSLKIKSLAHESIQIIL